MAETAVAVASLVFEGVMAYLGNRRFNSSHQVKYGFEEAETWLKKMEADLSDSENQIDEGSQKLQFYVKQVQDIAFAIEDALDEFLLDVVPHQNMLNMLKKAINNAGSNLSTKMKSIVDDRIKTLSPQEIPPPSSSSSTWSNQVLVEGDELVGFETHEEQLFSELMAIDPSRLVIFVVGPGGSGKSTLVNKVYRSKIYGDVHGWVDVPKMLRELEAQKRCPESVVQGKFGPTEKLKSVDEQKKKFLVVLDDARSKQDLEGIVKALPNGNCTLESRIIITSRNSGVASFLSPRYIHDLSGGLSWEKAKELFCKKAFHDDQGNWPPELEGWATKILNKCEGMPLAISTIGTFLFKKKSPFEWMTLHDSLGSELCTDRSDLFIISRNLQPSYRDLPSHLRNCFLYFSMFPEGYNISRERLIRLWIAEKFVEPVGRKTKEQVAEDYLNDLVERNLVVATEEFDGGRVRRSYHVLKLVREINISRRKSFITVFEPDSEECELSGVKIRRLSAHSGTNVSLRGRTSGVRTFLVFNRAISHSELEMVLKTSKFLRVLDLEGVPSLKEFPKHVVDLILLKYLSLRKTDVETVPESIKKLVLLETLDLKRTKVTKLPVEIKQLKNLRHLLVNRYNGKLRISEGVEISRSVGDLSNSIHKLSLIKVENRGIIEALGKLTLLRKLGVVDLATEDGKKLCIALEKMKNLSRFDARADGVQVLDLDHMESPPEYLQRLRLSGRLRELPTWIGYLTSLKKIGLHWSKLNVNPLENLQKLPNLIELDLLDYYIGEELVFRADTFKTLMTLIIERHDKLKSLVVEDRAMPMLKKLTVFKCSNLKVTGILLPEEFTAELDGDNALLQTRQHIRKKQKVAMEEGTSSRS